MIKKQKHKTAIPDKPKQSTEPITLPPPATGAKWVTYLLNAWIFIPALIYFGIVNEYAVNIPFKDDYDAILQFLYDFKQAPFAEKISLLFKQHNEHRILSSRLLYALYDTLMGNINFRSIIFIGNIQLLVIFLISIHFIRKCLPTYWNIAAFVWGLCLFDLSNYENADVAMTSMQNYGVIMLFFLGLYFYGLDKKKFLILAVFFQALCVFSSGNGVIGSLFIVVFTLLTRNKLKMIVSIATLLITAPLYFVNYTSTPHPGSKIDLASAFTYFLNMHGSHFSFNNPLWISLIILAVFFIAFPFAKKIWVNPVALPIVCIAGFILTSTGITSLLRSNLEGNSFYSSRYLIYPHLFTAITFLFLFMKLRAGKKVILWPVTVLLLLIMIRAYSNNYDYGKAGFERENYRLLTYDYYYPNKEIAKTIAENSCKAGIYCLQEER